MRQEELLDMRVVDDWSKPRIIGTKNRNKTSQTMIEIKFEMWEQLNHSKSDSKNDSTCLWDYNKTKDQINHKINIKLFRKLSEIDQN